MPLIIPIFIPHQGCPQQCLFCNQISISGTDPKSEDDAQRVRHTVREWLGFSQRRVGVQVAFYGGSFTCLPQRRQEIYLDAVQPFLRSGEVDSIRLSTRPDCIDASTCDFLVGHGVKTIELGIQSLDDKVLLAAQRGHSRDDSMQAVAILQGKGLELGVQLMPGLPQEGTRSFLGTIAQVVAWRPDFVRLYPTLVIKGSGLATLYREGRYRPLDMKRAIALCCLAKERLEQVGVRILRMGLQASLSLERELVGGPYHPAFGEYVAARQWLRRIRPVLAGCPPGQQVHVQISHRDMSAFVGPKRANMKRLQELGFMERLHVSSDKNMKRGTMNHVSN